MRARAAAARAVDITKPRIVGKVVASKEADNPYRCMAENGRNLGHQPPNPIPNTQWGRPSGRLQICVIFFIFFI